jgi:hypothetical protein
MLGGIRQILIRVLACDSCLVGLAQIKDIARLLHYSRDLMQHLPAGYQTGA